MNFEDVKIPMVVRLLSDDVPMTAIEKRDVSGRKQVLCQWRDQKGNITETTFDPVALVPVEKEEPFDYTPLIEG